MVLQINTDDLDIHPFIRTYISNAERELLLQIGKLEKNHNHLNRASGNIYIYDIRHTERKKIA